MPSKPGKYGILLRTVCDSKYRYFCNLEMFQRRNSDAESCNKTEELVCRILQPYFNTNRNVTMDRYYTAVATSHRLYQNGLTCLGTIMSNRKNLPKKAASIYIGDEWVTVNNKRKRGVKRPEFSSDFYFCNYDGTPLFLQSYICKKDRVLNFLSTSSRSSFIPAKLPDGRDNRKKKSEINLQYNLSKGGVDVCDYMCRSYSCKRGTRRWPVSLFFTFIDMVTINSQTICELNGLQPNLRKSRVEFLRNLALELIAPYAAQRNSTGLSNYLLDSINFVLKRANDCLPEPYALLVRDNLNRSQSLPDQTTKSKKQCYICSQNNLNWSKGRTFKTCIKCSKHVCSEHSVMFTRCSNCD